MAHATVSRAPAGAAGSPRRAGARRPTLQALLLAGLAAVASVAPVRAADPVPAAVPDPVRLILDTVPSVSAPTLLERLRSSADRVPGLVILDVRTPEEYASGHIPGARNITHDQLAGRLAELADDRDQDLLVYCRSGRRAASAIETLRAAGYTNLSHLDGDFLGWQALKAPVATAAFPTAAATAPKGAAQ